MPCYATKEKNSQGCNKNIINHNYLSIFFAKKCLVVVGHFSASIAKEHLTDVKHFLAYIAKKCA
jgi:hypothetical protein